MVLCALLFLRLPFCLRLECCNGRQGLILRPVTGECVNKCVFHVYLQSGGVSVLLPRNVKQYQCVFGQLSRRDVVSHFAGIAACAGYSCLYLAQNTESTEIVAWAGSSFEAECDSVSCQGSVYQVQLVHWELGKWNWDWDSLVPGLSQTMVC